MPSFRPFRGIRYRRADLSAVLAPPYDVISEEQRLALEAADADNVVRLELPQPEDGRDRYAAAAKRLARWLEPGGPLALDAQPAFYAYRMTFADEAGARRTTTGVIGALGLESAGSGDILPHERTTPKAKSDRLDLIRATRANVSPVWGLSLTPGLTGLLALEGPPAAAGTDTDAVLHEVWPLTDPAALDAIGAAVGSGPVVIADGHHRYEVALAHQAEQGGAAGPWDAVMALVVELTDHELSVAAIHRLVAGLPEGLDVAGALAEWFEPIESVPAGATVTRRMIDAGALALVTAPAEEALLLRPRPKTVEAAAHDLDSSRLDVALAGLPAHQLSYQHGVDEVVAAVRSGQAQAGVLLRPATVAQIAEVAHRRDRMPPKTTFFNPKPATGIVLRSVAPGAGGAP